MRISRHDWDGSDPASLAAELRGAQPPPAGVAEEVSAIVAAVAERGDDAVLELEQRFGGARPRDLLVPGERVAAALEAAVPELRDALTLAAEQIHAVAEAEAAAEADTEVTGSAGQQVRTRSLPVAAAGVYAPGGKGSYPSSVLMGAIPAREAGVGRVAVATPAGPEGEPDPVLLAACAIAGADRVYAMGGAQAIAAMALGTETVTPVDVIVGPGNPYVQEAKRQLYGRVGIEGIAGPSELMAIVGETARLEWIALDLCAQAEHADDGLLVCAAVESVALDRLQELVGELARARPSVADAPLALVQAPDTDAALALAGALAPEHLQIATEDAELLAPRALTAGCVFVGERSATAFGDYVAGSNHVLPTGGAGRFTGPLGPRAFRRRQAAVTVTAAAAGELAVPVATLARAEGFPVHGESAEARAEQANDGGAR